MIIKVKCPISNAFKLSILRSRLGKLHTVGNGRVRTERRSQNNPIRLFLIVS